MCVSVQFSPLCAADTISFGSRVLPFGKELLTWITSCARYLFVIKVISHFCFERRILVLIVQVQSK